MKKVLFVATVVQKHINVFHLPFLKMFQEEGYRTYVAASNDTGKEDVTISYCDEYAEIAFQRNPLHPGNFKAYRKLKKLIQENEFDIIHCHTPVGGLLGRLAARRARKKGTRVFYTAHGFHFYKGVPLKNWLFYYPVEKFCSHFTDVLITINHEDYALAKKKMKAKQVEYVPGVGVDWDKFNHVQIDKNTKRREIGVPAEAFLLLSVGEVNENKNHQVIVRALEKLSDPDIHYAIAGIGNEETKLLALARELGVSEQVHLLGYRNDIAELNHAANVFCFPSFREGLGLAAIEAMTCGLPLITSNVHGINDYSVNDVTGYKCAPVDADGFAFAIRKLKTDAITRQRIGRCNMELSHKYSITQIVSLMKKVYKI